VFEVGMSGFVLAPGVEAERDLRVFAEEVAPAVRVAVAGERGAPAREPARRAITIAELDEAGRPIPLLPAGELYIVQRGQSILSGRVVQPGRIEGNIEVRQFDQRVIGAWPGFLAKSPEIEPDPNGSRFTLSPVAEDTTCEMLRASASKP
jgi:hypothetical protein